jgi:hypothetical protein
MLPRRGGLLERVAREEWNIGIVPQSASDIVQRGIVTVVRWLPPPDPWHGFADPAVQINADNSITLFAERINYWQGRGALWAATLAADADLATAVFRPFARSPNHLSYPFPFSIGQNQYLTMEHAESGHLYLYRRERDGWSRSLLLDRPAIDPTILRWKDSWWLFCTFADDSPDQNLHVFFADTLTGPWSAHPLNPVKTDQASSRPAGPLFVSGERLIRPSQDCTQSYGGALVLNAVSQLDRTGFREQPIRRLSPIPDYADGLHTLCPAGDYTLIDGKRWSFRVIDPLRYLIAGLRNRYRKLHKSSAVLFTPL